MSAMLERILGNGVRIVLVEKADRLARDLIEGELILRGMRKHGITVIESESGTDLTAGDSTNPTATLIRQVLGCVAQFEKSALVAKLKAARGRKRRSGKRCEGRKPYGPDVEALVRKLRRRVIDGKPWSYACIATELDRLEIPTKNGNPWSFSTVADIVKGRTALPRGV